MDPRKVLVFRTVARAGSLSAAARELGWSQPAVSQQLAALEREVGVPLFVRSSRGVTPTEAGRLLLRRADAVAGELHMAGEELASLAELRGGRVRLVAFPSAAATVAPAALKLLAADHPEVEVGQIFELGGLSQVAWPDHCVQGSPGAAFHPDLRTDADLIIRKGFRREIDSYSAFFENDHATPTGLHGYLSERGITAITLVGLATDFCVNYSALDGAKLDYDVTVIEHLSRGIDLDGSLGAARQAMRDAGVVLG